MAVPVKLALNPMTKGGRLQLQGPVFHLRSPGALDASSTARTGQDHGILPSRKGVAGKSEEGLDYWLVVWNFFFHILGIITQLTNIFQRG